MGNAHVLIAEDDPVIRTMMAELLVSEGMTVTEASSGDEALNHLAESTFDLVVTDVVMPAPYGVQVAAMARTAGEEVPMLVVTAHRDQWIREAVQRLTHADILLKPFSADELIRRVQALLAAPSRNPSMESSSG